MKAAEKVAGWVAQSADVTVEMLVALRVAETAVQTVEAWVGQMVERRADSWVCLMVDKSAER